MLRLLILFLLIIPKNFSANIDNKKKYFLGNKALDDTELSIPIYSN